MPVPETSESTATVADASSQAKPASEAPRPTVDVIREKRAARAGGAPSNTAAATTTDKGDASTKVDEKPDAAKAADAKSDEAKKGATTSAEFYSDDEMSTLDLRNADLGRVPPQLRTTVKNLQAAERKKHEELNARIKKADQLLDELGERKKTTKAQADPEEEEDIPFSKDELSAMFKSRTGRAFMREALADEGLDLDDARESAESRNITKALESAASRFPELAKDQTFWQETVKVIAEDEDLAADFDKSQRSPKDLARVFRVAAAEVRSQRTQAERDALDKERKTLNDDKESAKKAREAENAKPGSVAAKAGRKPGSTGERLTTLEIIKRTRAERASG